MGVRVPSAGSGMIDPHLVDQLVEIQKLPIEKVNQKKEDVKAQKEEFQKFSNLISNLSNITRSLKDKSSVSKTKVESSNPEIVSAVTDANATEGSYEFEVKSIASPDREITYGFPDKDKSFVGFGYLTITKDSGEELEAIIEPGSTLEDVVMKINDLDPDIRANIINTNIEPNPYKLSVSSLTTGKKAAISIDGDTSFLNFVSQTTPQDLDVVFNDVQIGGGENTLTELVPGVSFDFKKSSPGTKVTVNVVRDVDASMEEIKKFVEAYNEVAKFVNNQFKVDEKTGKAGLLSGDSTVRMALSSIQSGISFQSNGSVKNLVELGISTDPKTGELKLDESKMKKKLEDDFKGVIGFMCNSGDKIGFAGGLDNTLKQINDVSGSIKTRLQGFDTRLRNLDIDLERQERLASVKENNIRKRFSSLEERLSNLNSQTQYMTQRLGTGQ